MRDEKTEELARSPTPQRLEQAWNLAGGEGRTSGGLSVSSSVADALCHLKPTARFRGGSRKFPDIANLSENTDDSRPAKIATNERCRNFAT